MTEEQILDQAVGFLRDQVKGLGFIVRTDECLRMFVLRSQLAAQSGRLGPEQPTRFDVAVNRESGELIISLVGEDSKRIVEAAAEPKHWYPDPDAVGEN